MDNPLKISFKTEIFPILLVIISFVASFYFYANFPERVITHWGFDGRPDGWSSPAFAAFFFPALILGMYLLFLLLPFADPKKERYAEFAGTYQLFRIIFVLFFVGIYFIASLSNLGFNLPVGTWVPILVGLLFVVIGNYLGKIKLNWYVGIKTPWTLSSEAVWNKTHRLAGKVFVIGGLILALEIFASKNFQFPLLLMVIIGIVLIPTIYSYILYRKEKQEKKSGMEKGS